MYLLCVVPPMCGIGICYTQGLGKVKGKLYGIWGKESSGVGRGVDVVVGEKCPMRGILSQV
jgi:hypothetical protein